MPKLAISRRTFLSSACVAGSGLVLAGCDVFGQLDNPDGALRDTLESANDLTYRVQRLLLKKLVWLTDDGETHELYAPIDIDADLDP